MVIKQCIYGSKSYKSLPEDSPRVSARHSVQDDKTAV